jgi:hypothetical protein
MRRSCAISSFHHDIRLERLSKAHELSVRTESNRVEIRIGCPPNASPIFNINLLINLLTLLIISNAVTCMNLVC